MDQKHRLAPSAIEAHGFLICHRADQGDCLLLGVVGGRCWGLVPGQHADLPNVALTAQLWICVFGYSAFFRGSSAGLMKLIPPGPVKLSWENVATLLCKPLMHLLRACE